MSNPLSKNPRAMRLFLACSIVVAFMATVGISWFGYTIMQKKAKDVNTAVYEASTSDEKLSTLQRLSQDYDNNLEAVAKSEQIVAQSRSYRYQDTIISDIQKIAASAGVTIEGYTFSDGAATNGSGATQQPSQTTTPTVTAAGLSSTTTTITFDENTSYEELLRFMRGIELNNTKMQIESVTMSRGTDESGDTTETVTNSFVLEVYVKS